MLIKEIAGISVGLKGHGDIVNDISEQLDFTNEVSSTMDIVLEIGDISYLNYQPLIYW